MGNKQLEIIHIPQGNGQPYYQQPMERIPRMPRMGDTVVCCAEVRPMDGAETMDLEWTWEGGNTVHTVHCVCIGDSDSVGNSGTHRSWQGCIPPVTQGGTLTYRFIARTGFETVRSQWFSFRVEEPLVFERLEHARFLPDGSLELGVTNSRNTISSLIFTRTPRGLHAGLSIESDDHPVSGPSGEEVLPWVSLHEDRSTGSPRSIAEQPGVRVIIEHEPFSVILMDTETGCTISQAGPMVARGFYTPDNRRLFSLEVRFTSPEDEGVYGFGERYNRLNQRGQILSNRVFEQYKNQKLKTYMPIPFLFTNTGWGLLLQSDRTIDFDLGATRPDQLTIQAETDNRLSMVFLTGNPGEILKNFYALEGDPVLPPDWVFGPWMSGNEWNSQARVSEVVAKTKELNIPAEVLVIEAWSDEATFYQWNDSKAPLRDPDRPPRLGDYRFPETGLWPDPKGMIDHLHEAGMKLVLWQIPVVKYMGQGEGHAQQEADWNHASRKGLVFTEADGSDYGVRPGWFRSSLLPDFAKEETRDWWFSRRRYLVEELGVDGFKTDGGEHLWGYEVSAPSGGFGDTRINTFPREYLEAYTQFLSRTATPDQRGIIFSRAGYRGAHRTPMHWSGDQDSTWDAYRGTIRAMLNANLSGISFIGWDIGGFTGPLPDPELYMRSAAAAVFSPLMQYHSEYNHHKTPIVDRTPWNIGEFWKDEEVVPEFRFLAYVRIALKPYLVQEARWAVENRQPLMQPLFFPWHDDDRAWQIEDSYMFGRFMLIAPILEQGVTSREVYLPEGRWTDFWTGEELTGPRTVTTRAERSRVPVYIAESRAHRESSKDPSVIVPRQETLDWVTAQLDTH